jgi:hypothetical protein
MNDGCRLDVVFFPDDVFHKRHHVTFEQLIEPDAHKFVFRDSSILVMLLHMSQKRILV